MDNHYHLLIETPQANLSRGMRQLNVVYTQVFNLRYRQGGHLFQSRQFHQSQALRPIRSPTQFYKNAFYSPFCPIF